MGKLFNEISILLGSFLNLLIPLFDCSLSFFVYLVNFLIQIDHMSTHLLKSLHISIIQLGLGHVTHVLLEQNLHFMLIGLFINKFISYNAVNIITNLFDSVYFILSCVFLLQELLIQFYLLIFKVCLHLFNRLLIIQQILELLFYVVDLLFKELDLILSWLNLLSHFPCSIW